MNLLRSLLCMDKKFLVYNLVLRNLKIKYRESFLGYFWTMLIPACQISIFYFLYTVVFKVTIPHYLVFLVSGMLPWVFFSTTLGESMESVGANAYLLNQMPIPIQVFPNTSAITNMVNLLAAIPVALIIYFLSGLPLKWELLLVIPLLILLYFLTLSLGVIFSVIYVYFRDLRHVTNLLLQIWFYATPVLYSIDMVPTRFVKYVCILNPVASFFVILRSLIFRQEAVFHLWSYFVFWVCICFLSAIFTLNKLGRGVIEKL